MSTASTSNLLIAAQIYGGESSAAKARRQTPAAGEFAVELSQRQAKDKRFENPTLQAPGAPKPLDPAKRFDAGAGRREQASSPPPQSEAPRQPERLARPGSRLDIRV